jgi:hypothetical protein
MQLDFRDGLLVGAHRMHPTGYGYLLVQAALHPSMWAGE